MKEALQQYPAKLPKEIIKLLSNEAKAKKDSRNHILIVILKKHYGIK